jgi:hypothetical protein
VSTYAVEPVVAIWVPLRYTRYPATAVLSAEAVQVRSISVALAVVADRLLGADGGVASDGVGAADVVTVDEVEAALVLPAASDALTE